MRRMMLLKRTTVSSKEQPFWDYNERGLYFYKQQAYDFAIAEFERAVRAAVFPLAPLYINLGAAYLRGKRYAEARACLENGLAIDPDSQKGHWFLGQTLKAAAPWFEALAEYERAWALDPESPEGRMAEEEIVRLCASRARMA